MIILFGFPCCGKTSVGKRVSELLQCPFIDTDQEIEKIWNQKCHALARERGLAFFREEEEKMVSSLQPIQPSVISLGGGAILNAKNYDYLKNLGRLIYLYAPFPVLAERNLARNPLPTYIDSGDPYGSLQRLYESREPLYRQKAQSLIETTDLTIEDIARNVLHGQ